MPAAFYFAVALSGLLLMLFAARITAVKLFLKRVWSGIESTLHALGHFPSWLLRKLDKVLIALSVPFLTQPAKTFRRHTASWRWTVFLVWYAGIFAAAAYAPPPVAVAALAWGIVGVVAINRAWVRNEKVRSKIGKKIDPDAESLDALAGHDLLDLEPAHPPSVSNKARNWYAPNPPAGGRGNNLTDRLLSKLRLLPDLRMMATVASLLLVALVPLLLIALHNGFAALFTTTDPVTYSQCLWHILDKLYLSWLIEWQMPERHTTVTMHEDASTVLALIKYAVYIFITMGAFRLLHIVEDIKEGVAGVRQDPDTAVLIGPRVVPRLLKLLADSQYAVDRERTADEKGEAELVQVRENALLALGRTRSHQPEAVEVLTRHAKGEAAAVALPPVAGEQTSEEKARRVAHEYEVARLRAAAVLGLGYVASSLPDTRISPGAQPKRTPVPPHHRAALDAIVTTLHELLTGCRIDIVRESAAIALGMIDRPTAAAVLLERVKVIQAYETGRSVEPDPEVLKHLAQSLGERLGAAWRAASPDAEEAKVREAVDLILDLAPAPKKAPDKPAARQGVHSLLTHRYLRVRNRAVTTLGALREPVLAVPAMLETMNENDNPKLLVAWANALKELIGVLPAGYPDADKIAAELVILIDRVNNSSVRKAAAEALAALAVKHLDAVRGRPLDKLVWALERAYLQDDRDIQPPLFDIIDKTFRAGERAVETRDRYSFDVLADNVEIVVGNTDPAERLTAARRLQPLKDQGSLVRLEQLLNVGDGQPRPAVPLSAELRGVLLDKVAAMRKEVDAP